MYGLFLAASKTTAVIMFLVAAAMVSAWLITVAQLPAEVVRLLQPLLDRLEEWGVLHSLLEQLLWEKAHSPVH